MTQIKNVIQFLEQKVPLKWQEDFDNSGLQLGDINQNLTGVLICLEVNATIINEAIRKKANLIISHHPLILKQSLKQIVPTDKTGALIFQAIEHHICIYAMHTNLDKADFGVSYILAQKLGLQNLEILDAEYDDSHTKIGLGYCGFLKESVSFEYFMQEVKQKLHLQSLKYQQRHNHSVSKVAVCGGSGAFLTNKAYISQVDVYITGDVKYHDYMEMNYPLNILDVGHYESEVLVKDVIFDIICEKFINFAVSKSEDEYSSIKYY